MASSPRSPFWKILLAFCITCRPGKICHWQVLPLWTMLRTCHVWPGTVPGLFRMHQCPIFRRQLRRQERNSHLPLSPLILPTFSTFLFSGVAPSLPSIQSHELKSRKEAIFRKGERGWMVDAAHNNCCLLRAWYKKQTLRESCFCVVYERKGSWQAAQLAFRYLFRLYTTSAWCANQICSINTTPLEVWYQHCCHSGLLVS